MGRFKVWMRLCPLSTVMGFLPLTELDWGQLEYPWWIILAGTTEMEELAVSRMPDRGQTKEIVRMTRWNLMEEVKFLPPIDECPNSIHCLVMNIIVWNCRGPSKPSFQSHVRELVHNHDPAIMIIMETCIGGEQAKDITGRLPFDGAIHTDTIGFVGGLWLLWNSDRVQVTPLALSEQEIHVMVKFKVSSRYLTFNYIITSQTLIQKEAKRTEGERGHGIAGHRAPAAVLGCLYATTLVTCAQIWLVIFQLRKFNR
ncbi:uncharacterized protein LOC115981934 isoform X1 [Quercus lobata]|uniref:uncharacterized protein LOC115981934 isoform X1 n=1 Tax=Quercus lobata TaxID=97700 RepID=UPI00124818E0|nr:uncharacterized protein LOC115981934 isoform X1 [Quercus lobata]